MNRLAFRTNSIALIIGIVVAILGVELLLQTLPVKSVHKFSDNDISQPVLRATAKSLVEPIDWKFSHAPQRKINNYGFVDDFDYQPKSQPIAVIGDSYVQSAMLPYQDTLQGHLAAKFANQIPVYSYGIPSYSLAGYFGATEYAIKEFQPRVFVFILTKGDLSESLKPQSGTYMLDRPDGELKFENYENSRIKDLFKQSALFRYLYTQIKFDPQRIVQSQFKLSPGKEVELDRDSYQKISERLLNLFATKTTVSPQNTIFILDSDRYRIYDKKLKSDRQELSIFKDVATTKGYQVLDTQDLFEAYYRSNRKKLDFLPTDFHWNAKAYQLVAERIEPMLTEMLTRKQP